MSCSYVIAAKVFGLFTLDRLRHAAMCGQDFSLDGFLVDDGRRRNEKNIIRVYESMSRFNYGSDCL